jgi:hypothetical protein
LKNSIENASEVCVALKNVKFSEFNYLNMNWSSLIVLILLLYHTSMSAALILDGSIETNEFFHFVTRFAFLKSEKHQKSHYGYVFGNITSDSFPKDRHITFAVLDRRHFLEFYGNR